MESACCMLCSRSLYILRTRYFINAQISLSVMSMNTFYNFIYGKKNTSTYYADGNDVDDVDEVVDENGFVMIDYGDKGQQRCTQNEDSAKHCFQRQCKTETLCLTGDTSSVQTTCSPTVSSSVADIPMQTSELLKTIESCRTISINHRKYLDLELFNYNFNTEISVLNDRKYS